MFVPTDASNPVDAGRGDCRSRCGCRLPLDDELSRSGSFDGCTCSGPAPALAVAKSARCLLLVFRVALVCATCSCRGVGLVRSVLPCFMQLGISQPWVRDLVLTRPRVSTAAVGLLHRPQRRHDYRTPLGCRPPRISSPSLVAVRGAARPPSAWSVGRDAAPGLRFFLARAARCMSAAGDHDQSIP